MFSPTASDAIHLILIVDSNKKGRQAQWPAALWMIGCDIYSSTAACAAEKNALLASS